MFAEYVSPIPDRCSAIYLQITCSNNLKMELAYFFWWALSVLELMNFWVFVWCAAVGVGLSRYFWGCTFISPYPYCSTNGPAFFGVSGIFIGMKVVIGVANSWTPPRAPYRPDGTMPREGTNSWGMG